MIKKKEQTHYVKSLGVLLLAIWLGLAFFTLLSQVSSWLTSHHYTMSFVSHLTFFTTKIWLPWLALTPMVLWLALKFPIRPENWLKAMLTHALFLLLLSLTAGLLISFHYHFFTDMAAGMEGYQPWQHIGHFLFGDNLFLFNTIIYTILITHINIKNFSQIAQQKALIASELNRQLIESQLQTLKMQINPHFLFNTLNVISVLVLKEENKQANAMINKLSSFFRYSLDEKDRQWLPLKKELQHVEQYLAIEQIRFGERIHIVQEYDEQIMSTPIPAMLLQPLIENAMQHGLEAKAGQVTLIIRCQRQQDYLAIDIIDDGAGCDFTGASFKEGIGLSNVKGRLQRLYGNEYQFTLNSNNNNGVTVSLKLPINPSEAMQ